MNMILEAKWRIYKFISWQMRMYEKKDSDIVIIQLSIEGPGVEGQVP